MNLFILTDLEGIAGVLDIEFMKRVYDSAMFVADHLGWSKVKCNENDRMRSIEEIISSEPHN